MTTLPREVEVKERQTVRISGTLLADDAVTPLPGSTLTTLTLTLYNNDASKTIINGAAARNIRNANRGTIDEDGLLVVHLDPADNPILNSALPTERHTCLFQWTWGTPVNYGAEELVLIVRNLAKIP